MAGFIISIWFFRISFILKHVINYQQIIIYHLDKYANPPEQTEELEKKHNVGILVNIWNVKYDLWP